MYNLSLCVSMFNVGNTALHEFVRAHFPHKTHSCFLALPVQILPRAPLDELLNGFETDLNFISTSQKPPIQTEADLELYASRVAGTVGELCCCLIFHHSSPTAGSSADSSLTPGTELNGQRGEILSAAREMGKALQYVNIARDIWVDATLRPSGRVYIPESWLREDGLSSKAILDVAALSTAGITQRCGSPEHTVELRGDEIDTKSKSTLVAVCKDRERLLELANRLYTKSRPAIEGLPEEWGGRKGMRAAIESYMEIGRIIEKRHSSSKFRAQKPEEHQDEQWREALVDLCSVSCNGPGRATVPLGRRLWVFLSALAGKCLRH